MALTVLGIGTRLVASFVDAKEEKTRRQREKVSEPGTCTVVLSHHHRIRIFTVNE
jgi:hypothetical protein